MSFLNEQERERERESTRHYICILINNLRYISQFQFGLDINIYIYIYKNRLFKFHLL